MPRIRVGRLVALLLAASVIGGVITRLAHRPRPLPTPWIEIGASLGVVITIAVGHWAREKDRLSAGLVLLLVGNMLCFGAILLPLDIGNRSLVLTTGFSLYVLSFLARLLQLARAMAKK